MMRGFYASPALLHHPSDEVLRANVDACVGDEPSLFGLVAEVGGDIAAYLMAARSWSTEYGGLCVWVEDLFVREEHRRRGIGSALLRRVEEDEPSAVRFRLEVERGNDRAAAAYRKQGYGECEYRQMTKER